MVAKLLTAFSYDTYTDPKPEDLLSWMMCEDALDIEVDTGTGEEKLKDACERDWAAFGRVIDAMRPPL